MKKASKIHGLDSLEKEILRLRLKAKDTEKKLDNNISWLRENASTLLVNSFFCRKKDDAGNKKNGEEGFFKNERFNSIISKIADRITDRAADGIDSLLDRIFHKRKHEASE